MLVESVVVFHGIYSCIASSPWARTMSPLIPYWECTPYLRSEGWLWGWDMWWAMELLTCLLSCWLRSYCSRQRPMSGGELLWRRLCKIHKYRRLVRSLVVLECSSGELVGGTVEERMFKSLAWIGLLWFWVPEASFGWISRGSDPKTWLGCGIVLLS